MKNTKYKCKLFSPVKAINNMTIFLEPMASVDKNTRLRSIEPLHEDASESEKAWYQHVIDFNIVKGI